MAVAASMTIAISRGSMSLPALVIKNDRTTPLGITRWREPAMMPRVTRSPASAWIPGDGVPLSSTWEETVLDFDVKPVSPASEAAARTLVAELVQALARLTYDVTHTVADAAPEVWSCRHGSVVPIGDRGYVDMKRHDPVWRVNIPAYPIREVSA